MSLTSAGFFLCLVPSVTLFHLLPARARPLYLLALSYAFYGMVARGYVALLVAETLVTFAMGRLIAEAASKNSKRWLLVLSLATLCAPLLSMKIWGSLPGFAAPTAWQAVAAPIGLSYYTFRQLGYLVEVYWDPAARTGSLARFALWVAFFPQIVSGPIQRASDFLSQIEAPEFQRSDFQRLERGCKLLLGGLFLKLVVADRLADFLQGVDVDTHLHARWVELLLYDAHLVEIFADLAGYTNLALGVGLLFGIDGPANFRAPFSAANIEEFWARWHISLTNWLKDYVYLPLRFSLRGWRSTGMAISLLATMILIGLWHHFSTGCLAFGILHAGFMVLSASTLAWRERCFGAAPWLRSWRRPIGLLVTFHWVSLTHVFVRATTFTDGLHQLGRLFRAAPSGMLFDPIPREDWLPALACAAIALLVGAGASMTRLGRFVRLPTWLSYALALLVIVLFSASGGGPFIYAMF